MNYRITGLSPQPFHSLFDLDAAGLRAHGIERVVADSHPGYPCRVSLIDAQPGETLLLLPFQHHAVAGPYQASGPIFVRAAATTAAVFDNEIAPCLRERLLSLRGYDSEGAMQAAEVVEGRALAAAITAMFAQPAIAYLHAHNARRGCYAARVDRA